MISVIVPVYNTEDYLDTCIRSLAEQTEKDLEFLLIDDGSEDDSPAIIRRWAERDSRIRPVFKEKNLGVSDSRNRGLQMAKGDYIAFLDSDDWLEPDMYAEMRGVIEATGADVVFGGFKRVEPGQVRNVPVSAETGTVLTADDALHLVMPQCGAGPYNLYIWDKLFRRSALEKDGSLILFDPDSSYCEDVLWLTEVLIHCKSVALWTGCSYNYRAGRSGNTLTALQNYSSMEHCVSAVETNERVLRLLEAAESHAVNNQLQRVLLYRRYAFRTAAMLHDPSYKKYRNGYFKTLFRWYSGNRSLVGFRWLMMQLMSDVRFQLRRIDHH